MVFQTTGSICLTEEGLEQAIDCARNHRLTELYLLHYADVAPQQIHQDFEKIGQIASPSVVSELHTIFQLELQELADSDKASEALA